MSESAATRPDRTDSGPASSPGPATSADESHQDAIADEDTADSTGHASSRDRLEDACQPVRGDYEAL
jgi:hypothetical protein